MVNGEWWKGNLRMFGLLITFAIIIFCTILGTLVAARAWDFFPARLFVFSVVALVMMNIITSTRTQITEPLTGYIFAGLSVLMLALLTIALLLLFSAMFVPQWWHGSRPLRWIMLPYVVVTLLLLVDIVAHTGLFVDGIHWEDGTYRFQLVYPNAMVILTLFTIGWIVHVALLAVTAITQPGVRVSASLLALSLLITIVANSVSTSAVFVQGFSNVMATIPIMSAMGYAVLRTRLLAPTRAGIDQAVEAMEDALVIADLDKTVIYVNPAAVHSGFTLHLPLPESLDVPADTTMADGQYLPTVGTDAESQMSSRIISLAGRRLVLSRTSVTDRHGNRIATLLLGRDVTEVEQRTEQLAL
jgi:PAS domain-containing protein